jgi:hypothetical protein
VGMNQVVIARPLYQTIQMVNRFKRLRLLAILIWID